MSALKDAERRARLLVLGGATGVVVGIAWTGSAGRGSGAGVLLVLGWLALALGIHRFGRLGAR